MKEIAVILCSNSGIDYIDHPYNIDVFRSVINFGEEKYNDYIDMKAEEFYERISNDHSAIPSTAFVSIGDMIDKFEQLKNDGFKQVLVITIAKPLSGLNQAIKLASEELEDENFEVIAYDSKTISYPQAYMGLEACRMIEDGKNMDEILERLDFIRDNNRMIFSVDTLEFLIKNGRLSKFAGGIAQALKIRPLLQLDKDGKVETLEKTRTSTKARELMLKLFLDEIKDLENIEVFIVNTNNDKAVQSLREKILEEYPQFKQINCYSLTPVVGAHCGPGTVTLGYIKKA